MSGHIAYDNIIYYKSEGLQGNEVTQMLIDNQYTDKWHGGLGMITMLYFSEDGSKITVRNYSPVRGQYFKPVNQYELQMSTDVYENGCLHEAEAIIRDSAIKTNATCHSSTEYYYSCECGEYIFEDRTFFGDDAWLAHNFGEYVYNNDATCLIPGTETAKCSYEGCNLVKIRVKIGSQTGHDFGEAENGEHSCNTCGRTEAVSEVVSEIDAEQGSEPNRRATANAKPNVNATVMNKPVVTLAEQAITGCSSAVTLICPILSVLAMSSAVVFIKKRK